MAVLSPRAAGRYGGIISATRESGSLAMVFIGFSHDAAELVAGSPQVAFVIATLFDLALF
jgi:hypothetical protein